MTPEQFRKLTSVQQVNLLLEKGTHLLSRIFIIYNVHLYILSGMYIEVYYRQIGNKIDRIVILDEDTVIELYSKQIGLSDISDCLGLNQ